MNNYFNHPLPFLSTYSPIQIKREDTNYVQPGANQLISLSH